MGLGLIFSCTMLKQQTERILSYSLPQPQKGSIFYAGCTHETNFFHSFLMIMKLSTKLIFTALHKLKTIDESGCDNE